MKRIFHSCLRLKLRRQGRVTIATSPFDQGLQMIKSEIIDFASVVFLIIMTRNEKYLGPIDFSINILSFFYSHSDKS